MQVWENDYCSWQKMVGTITSQAQYILDSKGVDMPEGLVFQGNVYRIVAGDERLCIQASDRGEIFRLEEGLVTSNLKPEDAGRFSAHITFLESRMAVPVALER